MTEAQKQSGLFATVSGLAVTAVGALGILQADFVETMKVIGTVGLPTVLVLFSWYKLSQREESLSQELTVVRQQYHGEVLSLARDVTKALTESTRAVNATTEALASNTKMIDGMREDLANNHEKTVLMLQRSVTHPSGDVVSETRVFPGATNDEVAHVQRHAAK